MKAGLTAFDKAILALLPDAGWRRTPSDRRRSIAFIAAEHYGVPYANKGQRAAVSRSLYKMYAMCLVGQDRDPDERSNIAREEWWRRKLPGDLR